MRIVTGLAIGCALGLLVLLGRPPAVLDDQGAETAASARSGQAAVPFPAGVEQSPQRSRVDLRKLLILDSLTGEPLDVPVEFAVPGDAPRSVLRSGEVCNLAWLPPATVLEYSLQDGERYSSVFSDCLRDDAEEWILAIPYSCSVVAALPQWEPCAGAEADLFLCRSPVLAERLPEKFELPAEEGPFVGVERNMTNDGAICWALRSGSARVLGAAHGMDGDGLRCSVASRGSAVLALYLADGRSGYSELELRPGTEVVVMPALRERPRIAGRLLDPDGNPVPGAKVQLLVALDLTDYDFRPSDRCGITAVRSGGVMHHRVSTSVQTDTEGRFVFIAPRGRDYALCSHALGAYGFWSTREDPALRVPDQEIELRLATASAENSVEITVLRPDGSPFADATILFCIPGDVPFWRQWPIDMLLDAEGKRRVQGVGVGDLSWVVVRHSSLPRGYSAPYETIGPSRRLVVRVPADSFAEAP